jgi:hypothetical protein
MILDFPGVEKSLKQFSFFPKSVKCQRIPSLPIMHGPQLISHQNHVAPQSAGEIEDRALWWIPTGARAQSAKSCSCTRRIYLTLHHVVQKQTHAEVRCAHSHTRLSADKWPAAGAGRIKCVRSAAAAATPGQFCIARAIMYSAPLTLQHLSSVTGWCLRDYCKHHLPPDLTG